MLVKENADLPELRTFSRDPRWTLPGLPAGQDSKSTGQKRMARGCRWAGKSKNGLYRWRRSTYASSRISWGSSRIPLFPTKFKLSLISPDNVFKELGTHIDKNKAFELYPYLRDPWTFQYFNEEKTSLEDILFFSKRSLPSLTGEIFLEEERTLSEVYEGIIRSLALGRWKLKEIADLLHSRGLIDQPDSSKIRPYFKNMMSMDKIILKYGVTKVSYVW